MLRTVRGMLWKMMPLEVVCQGFNFDSGFRTKTIEERGSICSSNTSRRGGRQTYSRCKRLWTAARILNWWLTGGIHSFTSAESCQSFPRHNKWNSWIKHIQNYSYSYFHWFVSHTFEMKSFDRVQNRTNWNRWQCTAWKWWECKGTFWLDSAWPCLLLKRIHDRLK